MLHRCGGSNHRLRIGVPHIGEQINDHVGSELFNVVHIEGAVDFAESVEIEAASRYRFVRHKERLGNRHDLALKIGHRQAHGI